MAARRKVRQRTEPTSPIEALAAMMQTWRRHWDEVGAIQRSLPRAAKDRLKAMSGDPETALAQTRHLFALEFAPEAVDALRQRLDEMLSMLDQVTGRTGEDPTPERAAIHLAATQLTVNVRDVVAAGESLEMHLQPIVALDKPLGTPIGFEALARFKTTP